VDYTKGYSFTLAPLVIKNLVLVEFPAANMAFVDY